MKRTTLTFVALASFGLGAIAAGPVAPREAESPDPQNPATTATPSSAINRPATTGARTPGSTRPSETTAPGARSGATGSAETQTGTTGPVSSRSPSATTGSTTGAAATPGITSPQGTTQSQSSPSTAKQPLSGSDQAFIQKAAEMNRFELAMAEAASRISENPEVRKAAQTMTRDLTTVKQQIESLAASKGVTLPNTLPQPLQDKLTAAESRTASQFDQHYLQDQIQMKEQSITFLEREGSRSADPDISAWAQQTVPSLKNHLSILKRTSPPAVGEKREPTEKK